MKRLKRRWSFYFFGIWALMLIPGPAAGGPLDPYIEGAKKEGAVKIGITLRSTLFGKPAGKKYIQAFQDRYPFLKVEFKRIGGYRERERVLAEMASGMIRYDVVTVSDSMVPTILKAKLPLMAEWKKLGVPAIFTHPKNMGITLRTQVFGIGYNRELIPDKVAEKFTWETCADPKWLGQTTMDDRPRHLAILYQEDGWGAEKTIDYAKRWKVNKPIMEASRSTAAQKLAVGAFPIICGMARGQAKALKVYGGVDSVGVVFPEPVTVNIGGDIIYVPRKAKHPNAGVLFLAWSATKEAQNILDAINFTGHPAFEGNEINQVLKGKKAVFTNWEYIQRADEILSKILQAMGFPVVR